MCSWQHDHLSFLAPQPLIPFPLGNTTWVISGGGRNAPQSTQRWTDSPCLRTLAGATGIWPQFSQLMTPLWTSGLREGCKTPEWLETMRSGSSGLETEVAVDPKSSSAQVSTTWCPDQCPWGRSMTELWRVLATLGACAFSEHSSLPFLESVSSLLPFQEVAFLIT